MIRRTLAICTLALSLSGCLPTDEESVIDIYDTTPQEIVAPREGTESIEFIIDTSGSMGEYLAGERKIELTKDALRKVAEVLHERREQKKIETGVTYFSHGSVKTLIPLGPFNYETFVQEIENLPTSGGTPLGIALAYAERKLDRSATGSKHIVMLTDGKSRIGTDPGEVYAAIVDSNKQNNDSYTSLDVIAFNTDPSYFAPLREQDAYVTDAQDATALAERFVSTTERLLEAPDPAARKYLQK